MAVLIRQRPTITHHSQKYNYTAHICIVDKNYLLNIRKIWVFFLTKWLTFCSHLLEFSSKLIRSIPSFGLYRKFSYWICKKLTHFSDLFIQTIFDTLHFRIQIGTNKILSLMWNLISSGMDNFNRLVLLFLIYPKLRGHCPIYWKYLDLKMFTKTLIATLFIFLRFYTSSQSGTVYLL